MSISLRFLNLYHKQGPYHVIHCMQYCWNKWISLWEFFFIFKFKKKRNREFLKSKVASPGLPKTSQWLWSADSAHEVHPYHDNQEIGRNLGWRWAVLGKWTGTDLRILLPLKPASPQRWPLVSIESHGIPGRYIESSPWWRDAVDPGSHILFHLFIFSFFLFWKIAISKFLHCTVR
jgi:hypothetical protein